MTLSRRSFLGLTAGGAVAASTSWAGLVADAVAARDSSTATDTEPTGSGRARAGEPILVVVQLGGGNDGLNTLIPHTGRYHDLRPTLGVPDAKLVALPGTTAYGLHPSLAPLAPLAAAKELTFVDGVGYPGNSRSHFQALDSWWTGLPPGRSSTAGWLGRWLDASSDGQDPLRAVSIGGGNPALRATRATSTAIADPAEFALATPPGVRAEALTAAFLRCASPVSGGGLPAAAQASVRTTLDVLRRLGRADLAGDPPGVPADPGTGEYVAGDVSTGLAAAANLVAADLGTRVIVVNAGGFDTHANQGVTHPRLLADLAQGIARFRRSITSTGHQDRVLLVTVSEFGRRAAENGSGTDHGNGGCSLVVGPGGSGKVVGSPNLAKLDSQGDVAATIDVRSVYAAALTWLGGPVDSVLGGRYDLHGILR